MICKIQLIEAITKKQPYSGSLPEILAYRSQIRNNIWANLSQIEKQNKREQLLVSANRNKGVINIDYYRNMIYLYEICINIFTFFEDKYKSTNNQDHLFLCQRMMALLLIEIDNIDEDILPKKHVPLQYFKNIVDDIKKTMPEVDLSEFMIAYDNMYKHWEF